jgi:hypothetical protein
MARPAEAAPVVQPVQAASAESSMPAHAQAHHSFLSLVEALRTRGDAS